MACQMAGMPIGLWPLTQLGNIHLRDFLFLPDSQKPILSKLQATVTASPQNLFAAYLRSF